jgi:hypothetical protein
LLVDLVNYEPCKNQFFMLNSFLWSCFGSVVYPTAKAALTAVLDNTPGLKLMLGELSETLIVAVKK